MSPESGLQEKFNNDRAEHEIISARHSALMKLKLELDKVLLLDETQVKENSKEISKKIARILGAQPELENLQAPLLKLYLWEQMQTIWKESNMLHKRICIFQEKYIDPIVTLTHQQVEKRDNQNTFDFRKIRNVFPERRQASIMWNNPYDIFQSTFVDEKDYTYISGESLELLAKTRKKSPMATTNDLNLLKQEAIVYAPVNIDMVPITLWHNLWKYTNHKTIKQVLTHNTIDQLQQDIDYFKEVMSSTVPLNRVNKKTTRRVQVCTHPDHAGKIFMYRVNTLPNPDGAKKPAIIERSLNVYDNIWSYLRAQEYITGVVGNDLEMRNDLLHSLRVVRFGIKDKFTLPSANILQQTINALLPKKNYHLVKIMKSYLEKLMKETHPERARNLLIWAENELLKRISEQENIFDHVETQEDQMRRIHDLADINWKRFGQEVRDYLGNKYRKHNQNYLDILIKSYQKELPEVSVAPYERFALDIASVLWYWYDTTKKKETHDIVMMKRIDVLLCFQSLIYIAEKWLDEAMKDERKLTNFPYLKWIDGTKWYVERRYNGKTAELFEDVEDLFRQIDLIIQSPIKNEEYENENNEELGLLSMKEKMKLIRGLVHKIKICHPMGKIMQIDR